MDHPNPSRQRQHGQPDQQQSHLGFALLCIAFLILLYGLVGQWDRANELEGQLIDSTVSYSQLLQEQELDQAHQMANAYRRGRQDAIEDLGAEHPEALAAACQAISQAGKATTDVAVRRDTDSGHIGG